MCFCIPLNISCSTVPVLFSELTAQEESTCSHDFNFRVTYFCIMLLVILQTACHFCFL